MFTGPDTVLLDCHDPLCHLEEALCGVFDVHEALGQSSCGFMFSIFLNILQLRSVGVLHALKDENIISRE